jgi:hypothetical protein
MPVGKYLKASEAERTGRGYCRGEVAAAGAWSGLPAGARMLGDYCESISIMGIIGTRRWNSSGLVDNYRACARDQKYDVPARKKCHGMAWSAECSSDRRRAFAA